MTQQNRTSRQLRAAELLAQHLDGQPFGQRQWAEHWGVALSTVRDIVFVLRRMLPAEYELITTRGGGRVGLRGTAPGGRHIIRRKQQ